MICRICQKKFHYCGSCGYYPEAELQCCTEQCAKTYMEQIVQNKDVKTYAEHYYAEHPWFVLNQDLVERIGKEQLGVALVDHIYAEY